MTVALSRTAPAPQPIDHQPGEQAAPVDDPAQYASRYALPQIAAHDADSDAKLADAHAQAVAATGGFVAAPTPAPPLPASVYHDAPSSQQWRDSAAAAADPAADVFAPKASNAAQARVPLGSGISGENALGLPQPPLTPSRLRDSDVEDDG